MKSCNNFEGSTNLLLPTVREIWILGNIGAFGANFGPKNGFHSSFSLITKSILRVDPLRITKQLLSQSLQKSPPSRLVYMIFLLSGKYNRYKSLNSLEYSTMTSLLKSFFNLLSNWACFQYFMRNFRDILILGFLYKANFWTILNFV